MARKVVLIDDLDGTEGGNVQTVEFVWAGQTYEIDLSEQNRAGMEAALASYVNAGREVAVPAPRSKTPAYDAATVRAWARENGLEVSDRGRINKAVLEQYFQA